MPSFRFFARLFPAATLALAAACADSTSLQPVPTAAGSPSAVRLVCNADVASRTVQCAEPGASENRLRADRILGQGVGVKLTSSNVAVVADSFTFDMTVTNQLEYPIGTTDGVNPDPNGIRVFFVDGIHTTQGSGSVTVANADGVDVFTAAGQAYFAYHGVLAPNATTASRKWKLRFEPGVEHFTFALYVSTPVPPGGGHVWMAVLEPGAQALVGDSVLVRVKVDSASAAVQSVKAFAADRSVVLAPVSPGVVEGTLHLDGLPAGPLQVRVHAVTVRADTDDVFVPVTRELPATLVITAPRGYYVASPNLRIDVDCAGCASITVKARATELQSTPVLLASGTTGIHTDVSMAAFDPGQPFIDFIAVDSHGHAQYQTLVVDVETSPPARVFVDSAGNRVLDVDAGRLLFTDTGRVWLRDRGTGARTLLAPVVGEPYGGLYRQGAIFATFTSYRLYDWRAGTLADLGSGNASLVVKGGWAVWSNRTTLFRRDLSAGTNLTVTTSLRGGRDVAENGDVVFENDSYDIVRYRGGVLTPITADDDSVHWNVDPVTDGTNVLYEKSDQHGARGYAATTNVAWWDGTAETVFPYGMSDPRYAANNGWIAWPVTDGAGFGNIRTRAPDGTVRQVPIYGQLRALGPDGTVVYLSNESLYVVRPPYTAAPTLLGLGWVTPRFKGTDLLLFLGNTVYRANY